MQDDDRTFANSEARLWRLIEEREASGSDVEAIDARIWDLFGETWAAVFTDLAGFSRQTARFGVIHFLEVIHRTRRLLLPLVDEHAGFLVKSEADSFLLLFRNPADALRCVIAMQHRAREANRQLSAEREVLLCAGIGYGRMLRVGEHDVWGQEVNAASKLGEDTASAHEILVTGALRAAVGEQVAGTRFVRIATAVAGSAENYRVEYD